MTSCTHLSTPSLKTYAASRVPSFTDAGRPNDVPATIGGVLAARVPTQLDRRVGADGLAPSGGPVVIIGVGMRPYT